MTTRREFCNLGLALGTGCFVAAPRASAGAQHAMPLPTPLRIPVWIDGRGPLSFIVDTGASHSALAAHCLPELARSTRREEQMRLQTPGGVLDVPTVAIASLSTAPTAPTESIGPRRLPVLPRQALASADGLLGADVMKAGRLHLDFVAGSARLLPAAATVAGAAPVDALAARPMSAGWPAGRRRAAQLVEVAVELDAVNRVFVEARIGRARVRALLDTGALRSIASPSLPLDAPSPAGRAPGVAAATPALRAADGSLIAGREAMLPALQVGARRWPSGPALLAPLPAAALTAVGATAETSLMLGLDRLAALEWLMLDYPRARLTLSPLRAGRG